MTRDQEARSEMLRPTPTSSSSSPFRGAHKVLTPVHDLCCMSACLFIMDVGAARSLALGNQLFPCRLDVCWE